MLFFFPIGCHRHKKCKWIEPEQLDRLRRERGLFAKKNLMTMVKRHVIQTVNYWTNFRFNLVQQKNTFKVHFFYKKIQKVLNRSFCFTHPRFRNKPSLLFPNKMVPKFYCPKIGDPSSQVGNEEASKLHGSKVLFTLDGRDPFLCGQRHSVEGRKLFFSKRCQKVWHFLEKKSIYGNMYILYIYYLALIFVYYSVYMYIVDEVCIPILQKFSQDSKQ